MNSIEAEAIEGAYDFAGAILAGVIAHLAEQGAGKEELERLLQRIALAADATIQSPLGQQKASALMAKALAGVRTIF